MSDTPETDAKVSEHIGFYSCATVPAELCRRLERERDEARELLESEKITRNHIIQSGIKMQKERDEAREVLAATKHYLTKERDDALSQIVQAECRAERFCQERDEAREDLEFRRGLYKVQEKYLGAARRDLAEARAELNEWKTLRTWGAEPSDIDAFVKGQQHRIHCAQNVEVELAEALRERDEAIARSKEWSDWCCEYKNELEEAQEDTENLSRRMKVLWDSSEKVCRERDELIEECAKISAELGLPPTIRPADGEIRRIIKEWKQAYAERDEAREQAAMWKANHDNQVALKAMLMERPDLGDRASRIAQLIQERDEAREAGWKLAMQAVWDRLPMPAYANDPMTPREVAKLIEFVRSQKEETK